MKEAIEQSEEEFKKHDKKEDVEDKPEDVEGWLFKIIDSFEKFMSGIFG